MTSLLVLGGGRHQVPLIKRAEDRGVRVVLVDYLKDAPGRSFATQSVIADATDPKSALEAAERYQVAGVITTGTDIPIRAMAVVAEHLGLPSYVTTDGATLATDKDAMARALVLHDVPMARRNVLTTDDSWIPDRFPVVVKPTDSQGQRGVSSVFDPTEIDVAIAAARSASRSGQIIVEDFLRGPEFTANAWIHDGEVAMLMVNDRVTFNPRPYLGIAFQHRYPSMAAAPVMAQVEDIVLRTALAYGLRSGPLYIQMIQTGDGPRVVEAAARIGGGHESRLALHLSGWNSDDALIDLALTGNTPAPPRVPPDQHALVNFILGSKGQVGSLGDLPATPGILEAGWYVKPGDSLTDVTNSLGRVGYFIAQARNLDSLLRIADSYYSDLRLVSVEAKDLVLVPDQAELNSP